MYLSLYNELDNAMWKISLIFNYPEFREKVIDEFIVSVDSKDKEKLFYYINLLNKLIDKHISIATRKEFKECQLKDLFALTGSK
mgnify:FL=1